MVAQVEAFETSVRPTIGRSSGRPTIAPAPFVGGNQGANGRSGTRSKSLVVGAGSLTFSLVLPPERLGDDLGPSPLVSIATAVAVTETILPLLSEHKAGIHWPNDVVVDGRKIAGILVEVLGNRRCVIGIGLNVNNRLDEAPPDVVMCATTLWELTHTIHDPTAILITLLQRLEARIAELATPADLIRQANALCMQRGETLHLRQGNQTITGLCAGIAPDGGLLLDTSHGRRTYATGVLVTEAAVGRGQSAVNGTEQIGGS